MAGGFGGPPLPPKRTAIPKPKNIREVPHYLGTVFGGFFKRFFYIIKLVWKTGKWIPFLLFFVFLFLIYCINIIILLLSHKYT